MVFSKPGEIMDVEVIRKLIRDANDLEQKNHYLQKLIDAQPLHPAIILPEHRASETLLTFAIGYIASVPDVMEALSEVSRTAGITHFVDPLLNIAAENFTIDQPGLDQLLDKAYFAHRLIEEAAEICSGKIGSPLIPLDMTQANLIVHTMLGEEFANQLDGAVDDIVSQLIRSQPISHGQIPGTINASGVQQWERIWSELNGVTKNLGIELKNTSAA